jgi:hypothetical protein
MPPFWTFAILVFFVSYGPNWDGLCATAPALVVKLSQLALGLAIAAGAFFIAYRFRKQPGDLVTRRVRRLRELGRPVSRFREQTLTFGAQFIALVAVIALGMVMLVLAGAGDVAGLGDDLFACAVEGGNVNAFLRFVLCSVAVTGIALLSSRVTSTTLLLCAQVAAIIVVAFVHWFLLADPSAREISHLPYRHVFAFWAPCIVAVLLLAPALVKVMLPIGAAPTAVDPNDLQNEARRFKDWLGSTEFFANRDEPFLSGRRLFFALINGLFYHLLHLLLIPALVALVARPQYLYLLASLALLISYLLLVWGNMSTRWDEMNAHIERWFLRGVPLIVSLLVIVLAILRVGQFDYISTILDALPSARSSEWSS